MNNVQRSALVARPVGQLFDLIEAAEHYPLFLPWCDGARIIARDDEMVSADIRVRFHGISFEMRTRNPKRRPEYMAIHLEQGPFKRFEGQWHLTPLGTDGCKVHFVLEWEFDSTLLGKAASAFLKLVGPHRSLSRLDRAFRTSDNYTQATYELVHDHEVLLHISDVDGLPTYWIGILTGSLEFLGLDGAVVLERFSKPGASYRCTWK